MKLMALAEALKDAEKAIEVDPTFGEFSLILRRRILNFGFSQGIHPESHYSANDARV